MGKDGAGGYAGTPVYGEVEVRRIRDSDDIKKDLVKLIKNVYIFAGRPTKSGADKLRQSAADLESKYDLIELVDEEMAQFIECPLITYTEGNDGEEK